MQLLYGVMVNGTITSCKDVIRVLMMVAFVCGARSSAGEVPSSSLIPLQESWSIDLGQPGSAPPAYDEHHAYVPLRDGTLIAVRLDNGTVSWSTKQPTKFSPAVGDGIVVVAVENYLVGLRTEDGVLVWTTDIGSSISAPPVWDTGWLIAVLDSGYVLVLRGVDGFEFWRYHVAGQLDVRPSVSRNELFVPVRDGRLLALDLGTGRRLWERTLGGSPQEILPLDDLFLGATDNFFYCLSRSNGQLKWRWRTGGDIVGLPAVDQRQVMFVSLDNVLLALDRKSGVQRWRRPLSGRPTAGPQIVAQIAFVAGVSPEILGFDTETGSETANLKGPGELAAPPYIIRPPSILTPGFILMTGDGRLVGLLPKTGPPLVLLGLPQASLLPSPKLLDPAGKLPFIQLGDLVLRTESWERFPVGPLEN